MRSVRLASAAGCSAVLLCLLASASSAQDRSRERAPIVNVYSQDGGGIVSNYVTPAIQVSEDAYVFAVMMDLDGHIQVLHPEFPGISVRVRSHKQLRLPNFFAGYNAPMQAARRYTPNGLVSYDRYEDPGSDTRGTVIAIASRAPFNLELIEANGDWNISEIRRLIDHRTPSFAAQALAQYIGAKGEPIGRDYMRFAGQRQSYYAYDDLAYCGYGGYSYGYDICGSPVVVAPFRRGGRFILPPRRRPHGDTTVFPKSRLPSGFGRHPGNEEVTPRPVPVGVFPPPRHSEPQMRDVTMPAPQVRRAEPREISDQFRSQPASSFPSRSRTPVENSVPSRAQAAPIGIQPLQRHEPRVIERPAPAPPPAPAKAEPTAPPPRKQ